MRKMVYLIFAAGLLSTALWGHGQDGNQKTREIRASTPVPQSASLRQKLESQFTLTQPTADKSDIATAGAVLVLHKNGLLMYAISNPIAPQSTYKKGKITRNVFGRNFLRDFGNAMTTPGQSADIVQRNFVTGEKFWVTKVEIKDDGVVFVLFSDPFDDVRYYGELKFPFPKGQAPPADDLMNTIAEVLTVEPDDNSAGGEPQTQTSGQNQQSTARVPAPASQPDTPPAPPQTIALGQTKDQVVAAFGQPQRVAKVGVKEIDSYPDLKVTFTNGKVTDVQ